MKGEREAMTMRVWLISVGFVGWAHGLCWWCGLSAGHVAPGSVVFGVNGVSVECDLETDTKAEHRFPRNTNRHQTKKPKAGYGFGLVIGFRCKCA